MDVLQEMEALLARARRDGNPRRIKAAVDKVIKEELPRLRQPDKARSHIEAVRRFAGNRLLSEISQIAWDYRAAHPHLSTATCNRRIAWLRRIGRLAYRRWGWLASPVDIELLPEHNCRHRYLTLPEVEWLLLACDHRPTGDAALLAVCTGMRQGRSSRSPRPMSAATACALRMPRTASPGSSLSCRRGWMPSHACRSRPRRERCTPISSAPVRGRDLKDFRFHDLRHTTASLLVQAGYSLKIVQEVLGHRSVTAANRYAHLSVETKRAALEQVFGS